MYRGIIRVDMGTTWSGRKACDPARAASIGRLGQMPKRISATATAARTPRITAGTETSEWASACNRGFMYIAMMTGR